MIRLQSLPAAGLLAGPIAWFADLQLNYALVPNLCTGAHAVVPLVAAAFCAVSLLAGGISYVALLHARADRSFEDPQAGRPARFLAGMGVGAGVLFAIVIALQGTAAFLVPGCAP